MECNECKKYKSLPRSEQEKNSIIKRLNIIQGQIGGISKMLQEDRYCKDILIQISACISALQGVGNNILEEHLNSCVSEEIKNGNSEIIKEVMELVKKLR